MTMLSAERSGLANLEWDEGFAMPVADSHNKQLEKQVSYSELDIKQVKRNYLSSVFSLLCSTTCIGL